jgi:P27 family predicted phage terminase small subunit
MGRPAKPTAKKALRGNPGKRDLSAVALNIPGLPDPPERLPAEALPEWRRVTKLLRERGDLSDLDQAGLADYCLCRLRLEQCEAQITAEGTLIQGQRGMVKNPAIQIARQYRSAMAKWVELFGLASLSRQRISVPPPEVNDDPDGFFAS